MKYKILILSLLVALASTSCEKFLDVNTDPNNPVEISPDLILPVGMVYTAQYMQEDRGINHLGNMMMFNWSEAYGFSWYEDEFQYLVTSTFYDRIWDGSYRDAMKQYKDVTTLGSEFVYYKAAAEIMLAFHFQILVDLYGDVPYTEALQRGENPTPAYDDAETIYQDLIVKLSAAIDSIDAGIASGIAEEMDENSDVMFEGDMTGWKQFANTLKLRILTRYSDVADASYIQAELDAIAAEGSGFITADVDIQPGFLQEEFKQNYYWDELGWDVGGTVRLSNDATCATQYILDYLVATNDPRINLMYEEPADGHKGVDQGTEPNSEDYGSDYVSNIGPGHLKGPGMPAVIFTLAESYLNQAELAVEGFTGLGDPETLYNNGVTASFTYLGADGASSYLLQAIDNVSYVTSSDKVEAIITQKWLATNGITAEQSWFDYSRTGFPEGLPISVLASTPDRPVRLAYPDSEVTGNGNNIPDQPDVFDVKIFWGN